MILVSVSISGNYAIVGAHSDEIMVIDLARYIYYNNSGYWQQQAKIITIDGAAEDRFGYSVSIYGDYAIVGAHAYGNDDQWFFSAYIF